MRISPRLMSAPKTTIVSFRSRWSPLVLQERALPAQLAPTQLLINVSHIALNPIDIKLKSVAFFPFTQQTGKEFSGVVESVGQHLSHEYKPGDRVSVGLLSPLEGIVGTKALIDARRHAVMKTPPNLSDAQAAAFPVTFGTAYLMLERTAKKGKLLVLGGASNVGAYTIQLARKHFEFDTIVATCSEASSDYVSSFGADKTIDYRSPYVSAELRKLGIKFDAIIDTVGGYDALRVWPQILKSNSQGGVYVSNAGDQPPSATYSKSLIRPTLYSLPWVVPRLCFGKYLGINYQLVTVGKGDWTAAAAKFFAHDDSKIPIDSVFAFQDAQKAWDRLDSLKARGKVLLATK